MAPESVSLRGQIQVGVDPQPQEVGLREMFETHSPSQVVIEGTLYPGVVFESHGRVLEIDSRCSRVAVSFDQAAGRIEVRPL